jgi:hypothetical protein
MIAVGDAGSGAVSDTSPVAAELAAGQRKAFDQDRHKFAAGIGGCLCAVAVAPKSKI